ncbi:MAG: alpha/beta hydrolase, partial [Deltaproteobacteria bacterium]|nr:alpha/beta hydrolase [Deltaproteobacteria bacterium]
MKIESIFIPTLQPHLLHLRRFYTQEEAVKIWMLHGSVENGKIFYSENGKGLAPYLAQQGF